MSESRGVVKKQIEKTYRELQMKCSSTPATVHMVPSKRDTDHHWGLDRTNNVIPSFVLSGKRAQKVKSKCS